jgi:hypothetical protein
MPDYWAVVVSADENISNMARSANLLAILGASAIITTENA